MNKRRLIDEILLDTIDEVMSVIDIKEDGK